MGFLCVLEKREGRNLYSIRLEWPTKEMEVKIGHEKYKHLQMMLKVLCNIFLFFNFITSLLHNLYLERWFFVITSTFCYILSDVLHLLLVYMLFNYQSQFFILSFFLIYFTYLLTCLIIIWLYYMFRWLCFHLPLDLNPIPFLFAPNYLKFEFIWMLTNFWRILYFNK